MAKLTPEQSRGYINYLMSQGPLEAGGGTTPLGSKATLGGKEGFNLSKLKKGAKKIAPELIALFLLDKYLGVRNRQKDIGIQREGLQQQAEMTTPENLYYQAALPQAKEEETMARSALLAQLSGGVIGPTLARGERLIGG